MTETRNVVNCNVSRSRIIIKASHRDESSHRFNEALKKVMKLSDIRNMNITQSSVKMLSTHEFRETYRRTEKLEAWVGSSPPRNQAAQSGDRVTLSIGLRGNLAPSYKPKKHNRLDDVDLITDPRMLIIKMLIESLTGHKFTMKKPSEAPQDSEDNSTQDAANVQQVQGWGMRYDSQETRTESEQTSVAMKGIVKTSDGKDIAFNLDLQMNRTYVEQTSISIRLGDAKVVDPIVVNFGGTAAQLTDGKFDFDLNADGIKEQIPFVTGGSGILAFDKNGDGQVNDGKELFGPATGNGFTELAALDEDNNNWIDENDSAFRQLTIWSRDNRGNETLTPVSQMNIGALFVGAVSSPFDLRDQATNNINGQVVSSGIYLNESGVVSSLQQINFAV